MYLIVAGFIVGEDLADIVNWLLNLVDVPELLPFHHQSSTNNLGGSCDV
jgi:hypothetical protein